MELNKNNILDYDSISDIVEKLKKADDDYYNKSNPSMTDAEYDRLKDILKNVDPENPYLLNIGAPLPETTAWEKRKHNIPMTSLDKCNSAEEFSQWATGHKNFIVEDKLDGISIDLEYVNGILKAATTRGDGFIGQNILTNVLNMQNVKKTIDGFTGNIRGEIVITKKDFHELCQHEEFKNARNAASGIAVRLDGKYSDYLTIFYYDILEKNHSFSTENDKMKRIEQFGLKTSNYQLVANSEDIVAIMEKYITSLRSEVPYDIDALVIKINDIIEQEKCGKSSNGNPKGQIAWKFPNETATAKIKNIEWSVGRNGQITPVAVFETTFIAGAMISRASLGSYGEFKRLKLHEGDLVEISRRNDVIPHVEKVIKTSNKPIYTAPNVCPKCGKRIKVSEKKLICTNKLCTAHGIGDIITWIRALNIKGLGSVIIEKLFNENIVQSPIDFYTSNGFRVNKICGLKVTKKVWEQLDKKREIPLDIFIEGLNIDNFGKNTARSLIKQGYDTIEKILGLSKKELIKINGINEIKAEQIINGLKDKRKLIEQLFYIGIHITPPIKEKTGLPLSGKSVLFSGTLSKSRKEMIEEAKSLGADVFERVTKDLSILVVPDKAWISDKTQKAKKLNIKILTEKEYRDIIK